MSSLRFEPAHRPAQFSYSPQAAGRPGDWIGRWADDRSATVVVTIAGLDSPPREYDVVVREKLCSTPASLLRHTFVQIFESLSATSRFPRMAGDQPGPRSTPPEEQVRTLLLPEHGILLGLYQLTEHHPTQWPGRYSRIIRYQRPATALAPAADLMLRQTPLA